MMVLSTSTRKNMRNFSAQFRSKKRGELVHLFFFVFLILTLPAAIAISRESLQQSQTQRVRELISPPSSVEYFTFGHKEVMADGLWLRSLQDFNYCENKLAEHLCTGNGWLFQMLDVITSLSPHFRMAYSAGSMALTIIISDYSGASKLFDKAIRNFPNDWILLYKAAYHATYEENDPAKAAALLERAAQNGAPDWVYAMSGRLYSQAGKTEMAESVARYLESTGGDPKVIERIRERIKERQELQQLQESAPEANFQPAPAKTSQ